jgi:hypothetical protein
MSKAKTSKASKTRKSLKRSPLGSKKTLKQVDLGAVREQITNLVGNGAVKMVETTIQEVGKGHYLAMKCLFEMIGLSPVTTPEETPQDDSLARTLLRRLHLPEETNPGAEVTKDCTTDQAEAAAQESDVLK